MHSVDGDCWPLATARRSPFAVRHPPYFIRLPFACPLAGCQLWLSAFCLWLQNPICSYCCCCCCLLNVSAFGQMGSQNVAIIIVMLIKRGLVQNGAFSYLEGGRRGLSHLLGHWFLRYVFAHRLCIKMAKWHKTLTLWIKIWIYYTDYTGGMAEWRIDCLCFG